MDGGASAGLHETDGTKEGSLIWIPGIIEQVACHLPRNVVACTLRLVDKATAAQFRRPEFLVVRLSQPVPPHAYAWRWGRAGATRELTLAQRRELLELTAATGVVSNVRMAFNIMGCPPTSGPSRAAAAAGQLGACLVLHEMGCPMGGVVSAAASGGHKHVCEALQSLPGFGWDPMSCAIGAARRGHVGLMDWALQQKRLQPTNWRVSPAEWRTADDLLAAAASGCDLGTLQRLVREYLPALPQPASQTYFVLPSAAASPTPDWRAKVEWLEGMSFPRCSSAWDFAARCPDAVERLTWLHERGYAVHHNSLEAAARSGNLGALEFLLPFFHDSEDEDEDDEPGEFNDAAKAAAEEGHVDVLELLISAGCRFDVADVSSDAAIYGHLRVVELLVQQFGPQRAGLEPNFFLSAARSGSIPLLAWLRERGMAWHEDTFTFAVESGCEAALEWLAAQGCPMEAHGDAFVQALDEPDQAMLSCLHRLGYPWGPVGRVFSAGVRRGVPLSMLAWLLEAGCPVDWQAAETEAAKEAGTAERHDMNAQRVLSWVRWQAARHCI